MDLSEIRDQAVAMGEELVALSSGVRPALASENWSRAQLGAVVTGCETLRGELLELRWELDGWRVETALNNPDDGEKVIFLWGWERGLRRGLVAVGGGVLRIKQRAVGLLQQQTLKTWTVRDGDTLQRIASVALGDWQRWREIGAANGVAAHEVVAGMILILPEST